MRKKQSGIYAIRNLIDNKVYIGQSNDLNLRISNHKTKLKNNKHYNTHLQYAYNKFGHDSFDFSVLEYCKEERDLKEIYWISSYKSNNEKFGYNLEAGGHKNKVLSEKTGVLYTNRPKVQ